MGEKTGIAWTDHTFNPWIGCQKVSAGCRNCYAARENDHYHWVNEWGKNYRRTSEANWRKPIQWAKQAAKDGVIRRVFCASLADVFDENVSQDWRNDLWHLIDETNHIGGLEWLVLTKRPENIRKMTFGFMPNNIRMGITAEDQDNYNRRYTQLIRSWDGKNFVSYEPAIGSLVIGEMRPFINGIPDHDKVNWVICGSESGTNARPFDIDWARSVRDQCVAAKIPFFLKQMPVDGKLTILPELDGKAWNEFPK